MRRSGLLFSLLLAAACGSSQGPGPGTDGGPVLDGGGSDGGSDGGITEIPGTQALFVIPRGGTMPTDFFSLPFPNDLRLKSDGHIDLSNFPPGNNPDILATFLNPIQALTKYWATNAASYLRFSAPVNPSSLPAAPNDALAEGANVFLVDVDPTSSERGTRFPLRFKYYSAATVYVLKDALAILPFTGIPLRPKTLYATVVLRSLKDAAGHDLGSPASFEAMKSTTASSDADVEKARTLYAPVF